MYSSASCHSKKVSASQPFLLSSEAPQSLKEIGKYFDSFKKIKS